MSGSETIILSVEPGSRLPAVPSASPTLVLVGSADPNLAKLLDQLATSSADTLDVRSGTLWTEVPDGEAFLRQCLELIGQGRDAVRFAFADPSAPVDDLLRRALLAASLAELANALELADLTANPPTYQVRFQPIIGLKDARVLGFESLIRAHAGSEVVNAEMLIARASRGMWLKELDQLGRTMALRGVGTWLDAGLLFLNVMAPDGRFDMKAIEATVADARDRGLDADQLVFETAERNRYPDLVAAAAQVDQIRSLGVRIAVDDVGDGFASLRVVAAFKPDVVKIAGHLVSSLPSDEARASIGAIVSLGHQTGAWVVAENIETKLQLEELIDLDVDWGQGLLLGAPTSQPQPNDPSRTRPGVSRN